MNKKILIFILLLSMGLFIGSAQQKVYALDPNSDFFYYETNAQGMPYVIYSSSYFPVEANTYMEIMIPNLEYLRVGYEGYTVGGITYKSTIIFYNEFYSSIETVNMEELLPFQDDDGVFRLLTGLDMIYNSIHTPKYFGFNFQFPYYAPMDIYTGFINDQFEFKYGGEILLDGIYEINYYANGERFFTSADKLKPTNIPPNPLSATLYFAGWYDKDGVKYEFDVNLEPDDPFGEVASLYSGWTSTNPLTDPDIGSPDLPESINHFLFIHGWDSTGAKMLLYVIISILLILGGVAMKLPTFTHVMVNMLLGGMFIFIQWIPLYIAIPLIMLQLVILVRSLKGGLD